MQAHHQYSGSPAIPTAKPSTDVDNILELLGPNSPDQVGNAAIGASFDRMAVTASSAARFSKPTNESNSPPPKFNAPPLGSINKYESSGISVDDFLSDLESALMSSPKEGASVLPSTSNGGGSTVGFTERFTERFTGGSTGGGMSAVEESIVAPLAPVPAAAERMLSLSPPARPAGTGASMQQRMFPTMGSSSCGSPGAASSAPHCHSEPGHGRSSSFDTVDKNSSHFPPASSTATKSRHTVAAINSNTSNSTAALVPDFAVQKIVAVGGGKVNKCTRVVLAGTSMARGAKSSAFSKW